jgi:cation transporter-like permease
MSLISLVVLLIVVGVLLWLVNNYIPMDPTIRKIINVVVIVGVVLWLLNLLFGWSNLGSIRIGPIR